MSPHVQGHYHRLARRAPRVASTAGWRRAIALAAVLWAARGCAPPETVEHYRVPKPERVSAANHRQPAVAAAQGAARAVDAERLLGAIVPHGDRTWYFKMLGPRDALAAQAQAFRALVASVEFDDAASAPRWRLPAAWRERPGSGPRLATLCVDWQGQTLEASVLALATGPVETALLDNVNRWRNQLGLSSLDATELAFQTETIALAQGQATIVDIVGASQEGSEARVATPPAPAVHPAAENHDP